MLVKGRPENKLDLMDPTTLTFQMYVQGPISQTVYELVNQIDEKVAYSYLLSIWKYVNGYPTYPPMCLQMSLCLTVIHSQWWIEILNCLLRVSLPHFISSVIDQMTSVNIAAQISRNRTAACRVFLTSDDRLSIPMHSYQHMKSHYRDKSVSWPFYL